MLNKKTVILLIFVIAKFVLQYTLIDPSFDLHRDEYLHLDQAKHLAWGYDSVPPFTSWISWIILQLGNSVFWVKFFPALFGTLTLIVVWKTVEILGGSLFAMILSATAVLLSVILRLNILYQPNSFDVLAWTCFYYAIIRYTQTEKSKWLYVAALVFAVGFLNKYNIVFLLIGTLPAILISRFRTVFSKKDLYLAMLLAFVLILPNLWWQYKNHFPVFHHLTELSKTQLVNVKRSGFLKEQVLFFFGSIFILTAAIAAFIFFKKFKQYRLIGWSFIFTLLLFVYLKAKGYYAIGLYPVLLAFGAVYLEEKTKMGLAKFWRPLMLAFQLVFGIFFIRFAFPYQSADNLIQHKQALYRKLGLLRWEDGKDHHLPQDFADMLGWKELAKKVDSAYAGVANKAQTIVYCDNYGLAGAVNYYSAFKHINAVSMNADYIDWFPPANTEIKNVILVKDIYDKDSARTKEKPLFDTIQLKGKIENSNAREKDTRIYLLKGAKVPIMPFFTKEILEQKQEKEFFH